MSNGTLGETDPFYEQYMMAYPDLMQDYQQNWANKGVTMSEYGAMHAQSPGGQQRFNDYANGQSGGGGYGGGGGGGGNDPYMAEMKRQEQAAKDAEAKRKADMEKNNSSINSMFDERAKQFDQYGNDLYDHNVKSFDENADQARQQTNFALARSGNQGGSVNADTSASLEEMYQNGLTNLRSGATDSAQMMKQQDNQQRNNLLQMSAAGQYNSAYSPRSTVGQSTSMTNLNSGVGNQFNSLLGGIGGASKQQNPWGY
jgi:hypothetical protein